LRRANNDPDLGKRFRNDETVPTLDPPAARILHVHRHDWRSGFLREKNDSRPELVSRTARSIRRNQDVAAGGERVAQPAKPSRAPALDLQGFLLRPLRRGL